MSTDKKYIRLRQRLRQMPAEVLTKAGRFSQIFSKVKICLQSAYIYIKKIFIRLRLGLIFLFLFFLETNFPNEIRLFSISPDLFFIFVFFLFLYRERNLFLFGVLFGFLKDIFSISKFPLNTIIFGIWSCSLPKIFKRFYKENIFLQIFILTLCIWINSFIFFIFRGVPTSVFLNITLLESFYGVCIYIFLFRFLKKCILNY